MSPGKTKSRVWPCLGRTAGALGAAASRVLARNGARLLIKKNPANRLGSLLWIKLTLVGASPAPH